jgi:Fic family protein
MSISQKFSLYDHPSQMEPLLPGQAKLGPLLEQAGDLIRAADRLSGMCQPGALVGLRGLLRAMNSYYSNRIEGQHTLPLAHMATEAQLEQRSGQWTAQQVWGAQMVQDIHQDLFARLPEDDRVLEDGTVLAAGALRTEQVSVGVHAAPDAAQLPQFLQRWGDYYGQVRRGELQVLAVAASHQRLAWIHPFRDGNGRVARLHTHLALAHAGLTNGLWSPLRGFARTHQAYYAHLAAADEPRAGDLDERGNLSEAALVKWIAYVLAQCADQVQFMTQMLQLDGMKARIAACLAFEENVGKHGVRADALRALHYLFATQGELERADFKAMLGLGDRLATAQVSALLARGLLQSDSPYGKLRFGVPQHALRFYFPRLWSEAEFEG